MRTRRAAPWLILGLAVLAVAPPARAATVNDRAASRAYLRDARQVLAAFASAESRERSTVRAFVARIAASCPRAELGEPAATNAQVRIEDALTNETVADLALAAEGPVSHAIATFADRLSGLRFTEPSLDRVLRRAERQYREELALGPSRLCADIRFARGHHWRRLSGDSRRFAAAFAATQKPPQPTIGGVGRRMKRFLGAPGRRALERLIARQAAVSTGLGRLVSNELNAIFAVLD